MCVFQNSPSPVIDHTLQVLHAPCDVMLVKGGAEDAVEKQINWEAIVDSTLEK